jgi:hypothetical protein
MNHEELLAELRKNPEFVQAEEEYLAVMANARNIRALDDDGRPTDDLYELVIEILSCESLDLVASFGITHNASDVIVLMRTIVDTLLSTIADEEVRDAARESFGL